MSALIQATGDATTVASASSTSIGTPNENRDLSTGSVSYATATLASSLISSTGTTSLTSAAATATPSSIPDSCTPEPDGYGPQNLSVNQFKRYPQFTLDALFALTPVSYVNTFRNLNASVEANSYLAYYDLKSYDTKLCSQHFDNTTLCTAFDIYVERGLSVNPTAGVCPDPDAITNYKCAIWGSRIDAAAAVNVGQYRTDFHVVIAASNGYEKANATAPAPCPGWSPPTHCGGAINAGGYSLESQFFPGPYGPYGPYGPSLCAAYAEAQASYNRAYPDEGGKYSRVNMFNAYMMNKNSIAQGTFCTLFTTQLDKSLGVFIGSWVGSDYFGVQTSWMYTLANRDSGSIK